MRRTDKAITDANELHRVLDEAKVLHVGMTDESGGPYVLPLNFARQGDALWLHCASEGRKLDCLRAHPDVCVEVSRLIDITSGPRACDDWTSHYVSVIGFGTAEIVGDAGRKREGLRAIMTKYSGRAGWEFPDADLAEVTVVRIAVRTLTGKRSPAG